MALKDHLTRFRYGALALVIAVGVFGISSLTAAESETGEPELDKLTAQELDASVNQLLAGDALRLEDLNSAADLVKSCLEAMELNVATFEHSTPGNLRITIGSLDGTEMAAAEAAARRDKCLGDVWLPIVAEFAAEHPITDEDHDAFRHDLESCLADYGLNDVESFDDLD